MEEKRKRLVLEAGQSETTMGNNPEQLNRAPNPKWVHADSPDKCQGDFQNYPRDFHIPPSSVSVHRELDETENHYQEPN